jgi:hypothetical protein
MSAEHGTPDIAIRERAEQIPILVDDNANLLAAPANGLHAGPDRLRGPDKDVSPVPHFGRGRIAGQGLPSTAAMAPPQAFRTAAISLSEFSCPIENQI